MTLRALLDILAPPLCAGCGASAGAAEPLCASCRRELRWLGPEPVALGADEEAAGFAAAAGPVPPGFSAGAGPRPPGFPAGAGPRPPGFPAGAGPRPPGFAGRPPLLAWAPLAYEDPARGVVRALKFKGAHRAAGAMAAQIVANAPPRWLEPPATLVPAPLHPRRARTRGYNQARLLAEAIAERTGLPLDDCLARAGPARTQVGRDRAERLTGIAGSVHSRSPPPPAAILVDDVITTGATLVACAAALGPGTRAIAYARTPGR